MFEKLKSLLPNGAAAGAQAPADPASLAPVNPLIVVGDLHGCRTLLDDALERVDARIEQDGTAGGLPVLVLVGDYIDRGPDSAGVLHLLYHLQQAMPEQVICLMGNHELMMLDFLADPAGRGPRWLRYGGVETLASFGITGVTHDAPLEDLTGAAEALEKALPEGMLTWLQRLPLRYINGNVACVHAGMDPFLSPASQSREAMLWGHPDFLRHAREDGLWVVHGHTIMRQPQLAPSRISIDTGAYQTRRLTVAYIRTGQCDFI